jgi:hypothetical protein
MINLNQKFTRRKKIPFFLITTLYPFSLYARIQTVTEMVFLYGLSVSVCNKNLQHIIQLYPLNNLNYPIFSLLLHIIRKAVTISDWALKFDIIFYLYFLDFFAIPSPSALLAMVFYPPNKGWKFHLQYLFQYLKFLDH